MATTFDTLIRRYSKDIAYLASSDDDTAIQIPDGGFTPERFTELVQSAADNLSIFTFHDWSEELGQAAMYLNDALHAEPSAQPAFLSRALDCINVADVAAEDIRLSC
ncbi:hypothetical protein AB0O82_32700 [Kitasatospora sp. NPDC088264]|uniref:hypothetical protein n=1 Tax=Kitasatospora sp. NPDC088264 TaxID=3155296 RepID=UPI00344A94D2